MELVLIPIAFSILDRLRGIYSYMIWLYAAFFGYFMSDNQSLSLLLALSFVAGESAGWGEPLGAYLSNRAQNPKDLHGWQTNRVGQILKLQNNPFRSLLVRGAIWAIAPALVMLLESYEQSFYTFIMILTAFVLSIIIVKKTALSMENKWKTQELIRGALIGIGVVLFDGVI